MSATQTKVSGPVTGGRHGWPFAASMLDIAAFGYQETEYFIEGSARRFRQAPRTEWSKTGRWEIEAAGEAQYRTRILVYRPEDPQRFNGTVVVTWNNVTAGYELFGTDSLEILEGGYALVCSSVQKVGIEGLPPIRQGLADWDPERYGSLQHPGDDYSFDIFTQIGSAVGPRRSTSGTDPMAGLTVERVIAQGASQSAGRLGTYYNAFAPQESAYDGFILSIYFGRGTPVEVGETVVNINAPVDNTSNEDRLKGTNFLRQDIDTPVFIVNSELEAIACHGVRQPDTDTLRWWESAGTCHVSAQSRAARQLMADRDQLVSRPSDENINAIPIGPLYDAAFHHMHRWLSDGTAPPIQDRILFDGDPPAVVRDEDGIACGGIRLPQADVPLGQNSAIPLSDDIFAYLGGSSHPFPVDQVLERYEDKAKFLARFESAAREAVAAGVLRPREIERLTLEAAENWPG